jgi:hypothetical protein
VIPNFVDANSVKNRFWIERRLKQRSLKSRRLKQRRSKQRRLK